MTRAALAAVALALAGMTFGIVEASNEISSWAREVGWLLLGIAVLTLLLTGVNLAAVAAVRTGLARRGRIERVRPPMTVVLLALAAALVMATPVSAYWDDGCNVHGANVALVDAPRVWLTEPSGFVLAYQGHQTLVGC